MASTGETTPLATFDPVAICEPAPTKAGLAKAVRGEERHPTETIEPPGEATGEPTAANGELAANGEPTAADGELAATSGETDATPVDKMREGERHPAESGEPLLSETGELATSAADDGELAVTGTASGAPDSKTGQEGGSVCLSRRPASSRIGSKASPSRAVWRRGGPASAGLAGEAAKPAWQGGNPTTTGPKGFSASPTGGAAAAGGQVG